MLRVPLAQNSFIYINLIISVGSYFAISFLKS